MFRLLLAAAGPAGDAEHSGEQPWSRAVTYGCLQKHSGRCGLAVHGLRAVGPAQNRFVRTCQVELGLYLPTAAACCAVYVVLVLFLGSGASSSGGSLKVLG